MAGVTYLIQECPTCGRKRQIRVTYLGKRVACHHCSAQFAACDRQSTVSPMSDSSGTLLTRVDQLLEASGRRDTVATSGP
jgi:hypothetical protein